MASSRPNTIPIYQVPPTTIDSPINWAIAGTSHMKRLMGDTTLLKMFPPNHTVCQGSSTNTVTRFHKLNAPKHIIKLDPTPDVVMMLYCGNDIAYIPQPGAMKAPTPNEIINAFVEVGGGMLEIDFLYHPFKSLHYHHIP